MINMDIVIYGYMFICFSLLVYNLLYIFNSKRRKKKTKKEAECWKLDIKKQCDLLMDGKEVEKSHLEKIERRIKKTRQLLSYLTALESINDEEDITIYLQSIYQVQQSLAIEYGKKDSMNRGFYAYVISKFSYVTNDSFTPMIEILLSYFDNSTVYCRENVLHALYALGNIKAVESALQILNDNDWFHHEKLLSDGLATFKGDKDKLFNSLWSHYDDWNEKIILSIINSITLCSIQFNEIFLPLLKSNSTSLEIRLAILRYYRKNVYQPAREVIYNFFENIDETDVNIIIVASFVLDHYPGSKTIEYLKKALCHHNWYVRQNAAKSLVNLVDNASDFDDIWNGNDQYAIEMLNYIYSKRLVSK